MNKFKKLATLCMALALSVGMSIFVACNNGTESSADTSVESSVSSSVETSSEDNEQEPTDCYKFIVVDEQGNPMANVGIQLCLADNSICYMPVMTNEDGICYYGAETIKNFPGAGEYVVHIVPEVKGYTIDEIITPTAFGEVTVVMKAA